MSPYHLTTREAAAMVCLQLAERAVTLLLAPLSGRDGAGVAKSRVISEARRSPAYARYMSSWEWAEGLFREGVLDSVDGGVDPVEGVLEAWSRLEGDPSLGALKRFSRPELFRDDRAYLQAVSADVLKAGPDPGVSIPIAAGLDSFASDRGLVVGRSWPVSLAQKAESLLGRVLFRVCVPALLQSSAERLLLVRAVLFAERERLSREVFAAFESGDDGGVRAAAAAYSAAFERERGHICGAGGPGEADEVRVIVGETVLAGTEFPVDAVLRSSVAAVSGGVAGASVEGGVVRSLVVKVMGRS